jgi:hypothetical protein
MFKMSKYQILVFASFFPLAAAIADSGFVAGLNPSVRPANAPVITVFEPADAWKAQALRGIHEPHTGLGFLKDQGVWYTPFNRPNLPGRYDIRGLHDTPNNKKD